MLAEKTRATTERPQRPPTDQVLVAVSTNLVAAPVDASCRPRSQSREWGSIRVIRVSGWEGGCLWVVDGWMDGMYLEFPGS